MFGYKFIIETVRLAGANIETFMNVIVEMCSNMAISSSEGNNCETPAPPTPAAQVPVMSKFKPAILLLSNIETSVRDIDMYFMLQKYGIIRNVASHPASFSYFHRISVKFEREVDAYNVMQKLKGMCLKGIPVEVELISSQVTGDLQDRLRCRLDELTIDDYCEETLPSSSSSNSY